MGLGCKDFAFDYSALPAPRPKPKLCTNLGAHVIWHEPRAQKILLGECSPHLLRRVGQVAFNNDRLCRSGVVFHSLPAREPLTSVRGVIAWREAHLVAYNATP